MNFEDKFRSSGVQELQEFLTADDTDLLNGRLRPPSISYSATPELL
jgi:hypothetical protein